ncbi:response regulator transcription factor [Stigmatella erecta]|uniref:Response regulator receiver domain-containing protein n=1 Tax=Stigmatella erecta TaxID=83460 RepID=A0A1I0KQP9_9BACT|nr:response regulator [Stigmatella erecta]SEU27712.1 Response regulator receiver domain-containing protein [Stigmatella erecta]
MVGEFLHALGIERVLEASNGRAAMEFLAAGRPDLVCLDLTLPDVSGYDLCEYIRGTKALATVPVLMISARGTLLDRAQAEEVGADGYLTKPFSQDEFNQQVLSMLARNVKALPGGGKNDART